MTRVRLSVRRQPMRSTSHPRHNRSQSIDFDVNSSVAGDARRQAGRRADRLHARAGRDGAPARRRKIEGQVRGLQRLVEDDTYCIDILTQIASVNAVLQKVALGLVDQHLRHCVMEAVTTSPEAGEQRLAEAILAVERLARL